MRKETLKSFAHFSSKSFPCRDREGDSIPAAVHVGCAFSFRRRCCSWTPLRTGRSFPAAKWSFITVARRANRFVAPMLSIATLEARCGSNQEDSQIAQQHPLCGCMHTVFEYVNHHSIYTYLFVLTYMYLPIQMQTNANKCMYVSIKSKCVSLHYCVCFVLSYLLL